MAMAVGGKHGGPSSDINVTPLIDVLLVLIIIFMVITPITPQGLSALVPQPPKKKVNTPNPRTVVVQVLDGNQLKINQEPVTWDQLGNRLVDIFKTRAEKIMFVKADNDIPFQDVAQVFDIARGADPAIQVGILTPKIQAGQ